MIDKYPKKYCKCLPKMRSEWANSSWKTDVCWAFGWWFMHAFMNNVLNEWTIVYALHIKYTLKIGSKHGNIRTNLWTLNRFFLKRTLSSLTCMCEFRVSFWNKICALQTRLCWTKSVRCFENGSEQTCFYKVLHLWANGHHGRRRALQ